MISKIDIKSFGLYKNYTWDNVIGKGNEDEFRRVNIIYGRNYSGKTTLSRIFKCIEDKRLHSNFSDSNFTVKFSDNTFINNSNLESIHTIRVYNSDFVKDNLSWLHNSDGSIRPFTVLGAINIELENKINEINKKLGSIEDGFGITHELNQKNQVIIQKRKKHTDEQIFLDESLKKLANNKIKLDPYLFLASHSKKAYSITDVKSEITKIEASQSSLLLDEEKQEECKLLLKENTMLSLNQITASKPQIFRFFESTKELVSRKIKPSKPITDLIEDNILQEWVRQGIEKHKGKRATCGFCGSILKDDLWIKIDEHFNKESELLRTEINQLIDSLSKAKNNLTSFIQLRKEHFYISLHNKFDKIDKEWNSITQQYEKNIEMLISKLGERLNDIFIEVEIQEIVDLSERVYLCLVEFNNLIIKHNEMTDSLATDQSKARESLRFNTIEQYLLDIDYNQKKKNLLILEKDFTEAIDEGKLLQLELDALNEEKRQLQAKLQDESKGAELVNDYLSHFFGHNELKLVSEGLSPNIEFKIYRNGNIANNLSDGESSLISFCYFIAKIKDELKNKPIIYIDDPISSLDSNHIFFIFSLIESIIATPKEYGQLFISTHNLEFLKYLKRLSIPKYKPAPNSKNEKADINNFIIDRTNKENTLLKKAPEYLKNYVTEFNYLFSQIYNCSVLDTSEISINYQYNFGNNLRKFLEAYLFFKYPTHKLSNDQRIKKFFEGDNISINLINRVINEYSHIGEHFDRGMEPVDIDEISKISYLIIKKIEDTDPEQFIALKESVSKDISN